MKIVHLSCKVLVEEVLEVVRANFRKVLIDVLSKSLLNELPSRSIFVDLRGLVF